MQRQGNPYTWGTVQGILGCWSNDTPSVLPADSPIPAGTSSASGQNHHPPSQQEPRRAPSSQAEESSVSNNSSTLSKAELQRKCSHKRGHSWGYNGNMSEGCWPDDQIIDVEDREPASSCSRSVTYRELKQAEEEVKACNQKMHKADDCCRNPIKCLGGDDSLGLGESLAPALGGLAVGLAQGQGLKEGGYKGIAKQCALYKKIGYTSAAISGAMAASCTAKRQMCLDSCGDTKDRIRSLVDRCQSCSRGGSYTSGRCDEVKTLFRQVKGFNNNCESFNVDIAKHVKNAASSVAGAEMSALCEKSAKNEPPPIVGQNFQPLPGVTDCSLPSNASNPICRLDCSRPGSESNPLCQHQKTDSTDLSSTEAFAQKKREVDSEGEGDANVGWVDEDNDQLARHSNVAPQGQGIVTATGGGGGSFSGGGLGGGGSSGSRGAGARAGGKTPHGPKVFKGHRGRTGYSKRYSGGSSSSGGFRGYGQGSSRRNKGKRDYRGKKFDLKQFLPGGLRDPKRRLAVHIPKNDRRQVGQKYVDVWKKITARYQHICKVGSLKGCRRR